MDKNTFIANFIVQYLAAWSYEHKAQGTYYLLNMMPVREAETAARAAWSKMDNKNFFIFHY